MNDEFECCKICGSKIRTLNIYTEKILTAEDKSKDRVKLYIYVIDVARLPSIFLIKENPDPSSQSVARRGISAELRKTKGRASHQIKNFYGCK